MRRDEVYDARLVPTEGSEQAGIRPVAIGSRDAINIEDLHFLIPANLLAHLALYITPGPDYPPPWSSLFHLRQHSLGLRQPERHVHGAVEVHRNGKSRAGLRPLLYMSIDSACPNRHDS